jgi:hypothetical protein
VSFGGPIVEAFGTRVPIPYLAAGMDYGATSTLNVGFNAHLLPLAYEIAGGDVSAAWFPVTAGDSGVNVGLEARLLIFALLKGGVAKRFFSYPVVSATIAGPMGSGFAYAGTNLAFPAERSEFDPQASRQMLSPFIGYRWSLGTRYALLTELKWHGANARSDQLAVSYLHPAGHGALTTLFALVRRF